VKEQVYAPDWTQPDRVEYTNLLFDLLAELLPEGVEGSVSTVPVSFKAFGLDERALAERARRNPLAVVEHIEQVPAAPGAVSISASNPNPCAPSKPP
jgi:hypothetical protein